ncbi:unnamed protein product [Microthlaspi erraticum]|uniref:Uncharacterized protein n=1 Tax=Microthlaspi erraticum TaxID=1685480 RepID=A0A6D2IB51_9BRAS|nr:unnamed protein product [Microthlaspi erraticum]
MSSGDRTAACIGSHRENKEGEGVDLISSLPDEILQHILSLIPTKLAVSTSVLSTQWRHVWCDTPSIYLGSSALRAASRMKTQNRYTAPKMMSLHLIIGRTKKDVKHVNTWIELAMSRHVENMSLNLQFKRRYYEFPDFFYISSSVKKLKVTNSVMSPKCSVSWASLKKLSLSLCKFSDKCIAMILSGCPILEILKLGYCDDDLRVLDLRNSLRLRTLQVIRPFCSVDLSSLAEAKLNNSCHGLQQIIPDSLGATVAKMAELLEKLNNVEKLTLGSRFLEILSLPELRSMPFPMFKIKALTLGTPFSEDRYVIPAAIEKVLQHSPDLKKLALHSITPSPHTNLSHWEKEVNHMATCIEVLLIKLTKAVENTNMVVQLDNRYLKVRGFEKMVQTLSRNYNNVSIEFSTMEEII